LCGKFLSIREVFIDQGVMSQILFILDGRPVSVLEAGGVALGLVLVILIAVLWQNARAAAARALESALAAERQRELDEKVAALNQLQAEMSGRMQGLSEIFGARQADMTRLISERLDGVRLSMSSSLSESAEKTAGHLGKLNERLAVIDAAQADLKGLTSEVLSLKDILANKQARGAYGQGRMEAIVRDALPPSAFRFQATLSNKTRPDCLIDLPGDDRALVIDAKFPLEGFVAFREARGEAERALAERRIRTDLGVHLKEMAEKYLLPGETQEITLMFVPSESIYADLAEHFEDIIQKGHRARVLIVSPSLLIMAIQVAQSIVRDAAVREQARIIQSEIGKVMEDVRRLADRAGKLDAHFRLVQEDVSGIALSSKKIIAHASKIEKLDFTPQTPEIVAASEEMPLLPLKRGAG
jgi:DNA recombination protein RmuC